METSYLVPDAKYLILLALYLVVLVIGPAIDAARKGRWGWFVAILLLSPLFGLLWYMFRWLTRERQTA